jgi:hypothetical protein
MNLGLSDSLKIAFPYITAVKRPESINNKIIDPHWVAGFVNAEGCFYVDVQKSSSKVGETVSLKFVVTQHSRDILLLNSFIDYFECGRYSTRSGNNLAGDYLVTRFNDINEKIIPPHFFIIILFKVQNIKILRIFVK